MTKLVLVGYLFARVIFCVVDLLLLMLFLVYDMYILHHHGYKTGLNIVNHHSQTPGPASRTTKRKKDSPMYEKPWAITFTMKHMSSDALNALKNTGTKET